MNRKCFRDLYVINITDLTHQHKMIILVVAMPPIVTFSMCIIMDRSWRLDIPHFINSTLVAAYCDHQIRAFEECSCEFMRSHRRCLHQSSCFLHHGLYVSLNNAAWMLTAGSRQTCWYQQVCLDPAVSIQAALLRDTYKPWWRKQLDWWRHRR